MEHINEAISRIRHYFNLELLDRDKEKLKNILGTLESKVRDLTPIKVVVEKEVVYVQGDPVKEETNVDIHQLADEIARRHGITVRKMISRKRYKEFVSARAEFIREALKAGVPLQKIYTFLKRDRTTIIYHRNENNYKQRKRLYLKNKYKNREHDTGL